jgi:hypothetical protein
MRGFPLGYVCDRSSSEFSSDDGRTYKVKGVFGRINMISAKKIKKKKKKKSALVICRDRKEFWTTQTQFWQWVRDGVVEKTGDQPLTGIFRREHEELFVLLSNTVLNLAHPNHLREALLSRRTRSSRK